MKHEDGKGTFDEMCERAKELATLDFFPEITNGLGIIYNGEMMITAHKNIKTGRIKMSYYDKYNQRKPLSFFKNYRGVK
jgi:hypothetical protein